MKIKSFRVVALVLAALTMLLVGTISAPAQINVQIGGGGPPPPPAYRPEHRWHEPYRGAYWIRGHYEWRGGWVWVGGYYDYPPFPGAVWVEGHVGRDGVWHPGHWRH